MYKQEVENTRNCENHTGSVGGENPTLRRFDGGASASILPGYRFENGAHFICKFRGVCCSRFKASKKYTSSRCHMPKKKEVQATIFYRAPDQSVYCRAELVRQNFRGVFLHEGFPSIPPQMLIAACSFASVAVCLSLAFRLFAPLRIPPLKPHAFLFFSFLFYSFLVF
jgi:hypothetical protein